MLYKAMADMYRGFCDFSAISQSFRGRSKALDTFFNNSQRLLDLIPSLLENSDFPKCMGKRICDKIWEMNLKVSMLGVNKTRNM